MLARRARHLGSRAGRRGDDRGEPRLGRRRVPRSARRRRVHPRQLRHAVGGAARARDPRAHARPERGSRSSSQWAREAGLHVSLDLIYGTPGESPRRLAALARRTPSRSSPTTSRPTRSSSRTARSSPARSGAARSPSPTTTCRPTCTSWPTTASPRPATTGTRSATGRGATSTARGTTSLLAGARLVGRRPGRAQPRRRRALVERQAPGRLRRAHRRGRVAGGRPRDPRRRDPRGRARPAAAPASREGLPIAELDADGPHGGRRPHRRRAGRRRRPCGTLVLTRAAGSSPTPSCAAAGRRLAAPSARQSRPATGRRPASYVDGHAT